MPIKDILRYHYDSTVDQADGGWVVVVALDPADVKKKKKRACLRGWVVDVDGRRVEVLLKLRVSNKKKKKKKKTHASG